MENNTFEMYENVLSALKEGIFCVARIEDYGSGCWLVSLVKCRTNDNSQKPMSLESLWSFPARLSEKPERGLKRKRYQALFVIPSQRFPLNPGSHYLG